MPIVQQFDLFESSEVSSQLSEFITDLLGRPCQPSASELLDQIEKEIGLQARWCLIQVVTQLQQGSTLSYLNREYLRSLINGGSLASALRGIDAPDHETVSTIDALLYKSKAYRGSSAFLEMINFMARFRDYAPYNNMLVRLQNPSCSFYATEKDWGLRFGRTLKEDAKPMIILAPMQPVMLVYDLDQTSGAQVPEELLKFGRFQGEWNKDWLTRLIQNAKRYGIRVNFKPLSSTNAGFATMARDTGRWKMRVVIHRQLDGPSRLGVLCHELAHILLGHLGSDADSWWPCRVNLTGAAVEIEAEAVAFIVTSRLGLKGSSAPYVSRYLKQGEVPAGISADKIAKISALIERMTRALVPAPRKRSRQRNAGSGSIDVGAPVLMPSRSKARNAGIKKQRGRFG